MLPVGEAETVGANISTNAERRVHNIEDVDRFIAASVGIWGCPFAIEPRAFTARRTSEPSRTKPESEVSPEGHGQPIYNVPSNPYAKVKQWFPRQVLPLTRVFRGNVRGYGLLHLKLIPQFSYEFTEIQFCEFSFSTSAVMVVLVNSSYVADRTLQQLEKR